MVATSAWTAERVENPRTLNVLRERPRSAFETNGRSRIPRYPRRGEFSCQKHCRAIVAQPILGIYSYRLFKQCLPSLIVWPYIGFSMICSLMSAPHRAISNQLITNSVPASEDWFCPNNPLRDAPSNVMRCKQVQCGTSFPTAVEIARLIGLYRRR